MVQSGYARSHGLGDKLSAAFVSVSARTAGFNALDIGALTHESWALHYFLMFIGGGSAGTAGGVKVGTVAILALLVIAEIRGRADTEAFGRRVGSSAQRQAITVLVLGSAMVVLGTLVILRDTDIPTDQVIFEVISAFGTVGLSTGITADLPETSQLMLTLLVRRPGRHHHPGRLARAGRAPHALPLSGGSTQLLAKLLFSEQFSSKGDSVVVIGLALWQLGGALADALAMT